MQLFFSYFKELVGKQVTVELKNELAITGYLHSVDQYLNIKLVNCRVVDEIKYPHMVRDTRLEPSGRFQMDSVAHLAHSATFMPSPQHTAFAEIRATLLGSQGQQSVLGRGLTV